MPAHDLRLSLVIGHPFRIFDCAGLQYDCAEGGCDYRELETLDEFNRRQPERKEMFCGSVFTVADRGCTCGRATEQEIEDLRQQVRMDINAHV